MVESIRNGDRIHAISFGKFYLNAYGDIATREEIKEVFGNWNIDNGSSFITQDAKDIDPNVLGALEIIKSIEGVNNVEVIGEKEEGSVDYRIKTNIDVDIRKVLFSEIAKNELYIIELNKEKLSLEDVFMEITTKEKDEAKEVENNE
jgi:hypothetical protein